MRPGKPGGPGATGGTTKTTTSTDGTTRTSTDSGEAPNKRGDNTFTLSAPLLPTRLKQSESKVVAIGIKRKNFDQDVTLKFEGLPKGVTIDPAAPTIKHGDTEAKVTVRAADDAAVGNFTVTVKGHPAEGADATLDLKITVLQK